MLCCGATGVSRFLPTSRRLVQFSEGKSAAEGSTIVYIDGAFDVFHAGHVEILRVSANSGRWQTARAVAGPDMQCTQLHKAQLSKQPKTQPHHSVTP
jgi:ethanolamine-phosphate cytidylyltransferase